MLNSKIEIGNIVRSTSIETCFDIGEVKQIFHTGKFETANVYTDGIILRVFTDFLVLVSDEEAMLWKLENV